MCVWGEGWGWGVCVCGGRGLQCGYIIHFHTVREKLSLTSRTDKRFCGSGRLNILRELQFTTTSANGWLGLVVQLFTH